MEAYTYIHFILYCVGDNLAAQSSIQCLKPRSATTSNMEYVSPKSVLLQPKLLNSSMDGGEYKTKYIFHVVGVSRSREFEI